MMAPVSYIMPRIYYSIYMKYMKVLFAVKPIWKPFRIIILNYHNQKLINMLFIVIYLFYLKENMGKNCNCHKCQKKQKSHHEDKKGKKLITVAVGDGPNREKDTTHGPFPLRQGAELYLYSKSLKLTAKPGSALVGIEKEASHIHMYNLVDPAKCPYPVGQVGEVTAFRPGEYKSYSNPSSIAPTGKSAPIFTGDQGVPYWTINVPGYYSYEYTVTVSSVQTLIMYVFIIRKTSGNTDRLYDNTVSSDTATAKGFVDIESGDQLSAVVQLPGYSNPKDLCKTSSMYCIDKI